MNDYSVIKQHICNNIHTKGRLSETSISEQIHSTRNVIESIGLQMFAQILAVENLSALTNDAWERMQRELESEFNVKHTRGFLVQGDDQRERDTTWWTDDKRPKNENYYWERYNKYLKKSLPPEVVKVIDVDTDIVMNNIEDPEVEVFSRYGMVVGHVQSGKTANYSALLCKAADAGYKCIVVIAGGINNLRNQTQKRLNESFVGIDSKGFQTGCGVGEDKKSRLPVSLTTVESDFNVQDANRSLQGLNFDNISTPVLLVIKKNTHTLTNIINWLEGQYPNQITKHSMLMIDDESDYASINTGEEEDPTTINRKIRKLLSMFSQSSYVAYTATPYANIFIDHEAGNDDIGDDLFPNDFIYALDAPDNYFGARRIFCDPELKHIVKIDDFQDVLPLKHKSIDELPFIPESLKESIRVFILNISIRHLRGQSDKHNSMLVHATRFTAMHQKIFQHIEEYTQSIVKDVEAYASLDDATVQSVLIKDLKETFLKTYFRNHVDKDLEFDWIKVLNNLSNIIRTIVIREVHQSTSVPLQYRDDHPTNAIVIGGTSLSRGYTLEGLSVSYFLRNTVFYDTLMQMGRWFGYRPGYDDLCRVYMTASMAENFSFIIEDTEDLIEDFKIMAEQNRTPNDFGLTVKQRPESALQVTARNKQKNIHTLQCNMRLDGQLKETSWLPSDVLKKSENLDLIKNFIKTMGNENEKIRNNYIWRGIDREYIYDFIDSFHIHLNDAIGIEAKMPIAFIKEYVKNNDTEWDVALLSGDGQREEVTGKNITREKRKVTMKEGYIEIYRRQVSSGAAEAITLDETLRKKLGSNRKAARKELKNPVLRIHILETDLDKNLGAFSMSFPGDGLDQGKLISLQINTVAFKNLMKNFEEGLEEMSDD
jgi:hypothetical protein